MGFQAGVALLRAAVAAPCPPALHSRRAPALRSAPLDRGPRGDPGPGSAAPRDKERPGGAAEGESERRPGRPRRQGRPQPPPAHPHTCARLGEPERGAVKAARRPPPALRPIPSPALWVRRDLPPAPRPPPRTARAARTRPFIARPEVTSAPQSCPARRAERDEQLRKQSGNERGEATPTRAPPVNDEIRTEPSESGKGRAVPERTRCSEITEGVLLSPTNLLEQ
ncbi:basic proline-rich protein-like [Onychostruthus taczanowskii]|uniref:basic proline-rich protein-like n=1 Tax=Onychostruthus taczanowskii TaxID=356909 RepID=UPI001B80D322|nr:basic proline-rich protein-like [Onychostruthus taczanowskii]